MEEDTGMDATEDVGKDAVVSELLDVIDDRPLSLQLNQSQSLAMLWESGILFVHCRAVLLEQLPWSLD